MGFNYLTGTYQMQQQKYYLNWQFISVWNQTVNWWMIGVVSHS